MEDEKILDIPYYETAYLDDNNTKHLAYIKDKDVVEFLQERFTVLECHLVTP